MSGIVGGAFKEAMMKKFPDMSSQGKGLNYFSMGGVMISATGSTAGKGYFSMEFRAAEASRVLLSPKI